MNSKKSKLPRIAGLSAKGLVKGQAPEPALPAAHAGATIAIYSVKGGVGKTTLAANLAWASATQGHHRTLLWDLDAAGGSGFLYGIEPGTGHLAEDVFSRDRPAASLIQHTAWDRLDVLPADDSIRALDAQLAQIGKRKRLARLTEELTADYARVVLDCPPVMNELSAQIIRAADLVIVPLPPSPLSSRAFELVVREIAGSGKHHPPILPVLSMLDLRRALHRQARDDHPDWPAVPYASVVEQGAVHRQPVATLAPASAAAQAFAGLWRAIDRKLAERG